MQRALAEVVHHWVMVTTTIKDAHRSRFSVITLKQFTEVLFHRQIQLIQGKTARFLFKFLQRSGDQGSGDLRYGIRGTSFG